MMFKTSYNSIYYINNNNFKILVFLAVILFGLYFISFIHFQPQNVCPPTTINKIIPTDFYNNTYPLTKPEKSKNFIRYKLGLIADLDKESKKVYKDTWSSFLLEGTLIFYPSTKKVITNFNSDKTLISSSLSYKKRGMELSELIVFNGKLLSCDDRTGIIYELIRTDEENKIFSDMKLNNLTYKDIQFNNKFYKALPWVILLDGDGLKEKPFKCEWLTIKDHFLYAGGFGKDWTSPEGKFLNHDPLWIKRISVNGEIKHINWLYNYGKMLNQVGLKEPGYLIHESSVWSELRKKWFFLPRKASSKIYNEEDDEKKGANLLIIADENFKTVEVVKIGDAPNPLLGYSSFKFIPNFNDEYIIALKSKEVKNEISTYITVFDIKGQIILPETLIDNQVKFEGIEFI